MNLHLCTFKTPILLRDISDNSLLPIQLHRPKRKITKFLFFYKKFVSFFFLVGVIDIHENKRKFIIEKVINDSTVILLVDKKESELICSDNSELFCFGQFINDMHILKKEIIFSVGISAIQELDKQIQSAQNKREELENIIKLQQSQIDMLVRRLENSGF